MDKLIKATMIAALPQCTDRITGEVNATGLAEWSAVELGITDRLDDDTDPIWDIALEVAQ